jgi:hypothetical protein
MLFDFKGWLVDGALSKLAVAEKIKRRIAKANPIAVNVPKTEAKKLRRKFMRNVLVLQI